MSGRAIRVFFDHQIFSIQRFGGISTVFANYLWQFERAELGVEAVLGCRFTNNHHVRHMFPGRFRGMPDLPGIGRLMRRLNRRDARAARRAADIWHPTYYLPEELPPDGRMVASVHDMTPELMPHHFRHGNPHLAKEEYCRRAGLAVCVTEHTRGDLMTVYGIAAERTRVVPLGIDLARAVHEVEPIAGLPCDFLLFVGNRGGNKNFGVALEAFARAAGHDHGLHLLCVGSAFDGAEEARISELGLAGRTHRVAASDAQLRYLYRRARAFVFPSLYEGFGIPILEALAQRCPTVLAQASCFPEIGRDAAIYFAPREVPSCAEAIERALADRRGNDARAERGLAICREMSWRRSAEKMAAVYRDLFERGPN